jgi:NADPH:quinone reductase-like Zn-dependent oxidoreductase
MPVAYLTAYRMLFTRGRLLPGQRVLIQGAGGGVATAAILLARSAGLHVTVTSRDEDRLERAIELGAHEGIPSGQRLPQRVHAVLETVGEATWEHSLKALEPGGVVVVSGATSGPNPPADLNRVFFRQLEVVGSTMGTRDGAGPPAGPAGRDRRAPGDRRRPAVGRGAHRLPAPRRRRGVRQAGADPLTTPAPGAAGRVTGAWQARRL